MNGSILLFATLLLSALAVAPAAIAEQLNRQPLIDLSLPVGASWKPGSTPPTAGWLALGCGELDCVLTAVAVQASAEHRSDRNGLVVEGHRLTMTSETPANHKVLMLLHADPPPAWLRSGPVATLYPVPGALPRHPQEGDFAMSLQWPDGVLDQLIPVRLASDNDTEVFALRLRRGPQVQWLGVVPLCRHGLHDQYLLWAGDLDQDGFGDYLIDLSGTGAAPRLLLSGHAGPGELVGLAAGSDRTAPACW